MTPTKSPNESDRTDATDLSDQPTLTTDQQPSPSDDAIASKATSGGAMERWEEYLAETFGI